MLPALELEITADPSNAEAGLARTASSLNKVETEYKQAAVAANTYTGASKKMTAANAAATAGAKRNSQSMRMMSMQLSQVASQGAATGNYLQALAIQAPDLALGFGTVGIIAGALVPVLYGVAQGVFDTGDKAEEGKDKLENFTAAISAARAQADISKASISDLREEYGEFAEAVRNAALITAQAALSTAMVEYSDAASTIADGLSNVEEKTLAYQAAAERLEITQRSLGERTLMNASAFEEAERAVDEARAEMEAAASSIGLTAAQSRDLTAALSDVAGAQGMDAVATAAGQALALISSMFNETTNIPPEVAKIVANLQGVLSAAAAGETAIGGITDETGKAADEAARLADNLAFAKSLSKQFRESQVRAGVADGSIPPEALGDLSNPQEDILQRLNQQRRSRAAAAARQSGKSAGGRKGRGEVNPLIAQLEQVQNALMTEEEAQIASFKRQQKTLKSALEQQMLTRKEYNDAMQKAKAQHSEKMAEIDAYSHGDALQKTGKFMGAMAAALQSGGEKTEKAARIFGAAEALINAWRAYSQVLADPALPFFAKIPAALSVLSAGLGAVNAIKGSGGGGAGSASTTAANANTAPQQSNQVFVRLEGSQMYSGEQIATTLSNYVKDGGQIAGFTTA